MVQDMPHPLVSTTILRVAAEKTEIPWACSPTIDGEHVQIDRKSMKELFSSIEQ